MRLKDIFKSEKTDYGLTIFDPKYIAQLEQELIAPDLFGEKSHFSLRCPVRNKNIKLTPEEIIRQLYLKVLIDKLQYPIQRIELEYPISFGREKKRADIVIFDKDRSDVPYIIIELKKPKLKDGKEQLKSYCNATGAPLAVWTNGEQISYYYRKDPNYFEEMSRIPDASQKLSDIFSEKLTLEDLIQKDRHNTKSLKNRILEMEDEVLANAGVDVFEECFKLIFIKLFDEYESGRNPKRYLQFRNIGTEQELKDHIKILFDKAKAQWHGVFALERLYYQKY
jgi:type I restriction enzyme M protein